MGKLSLCLAGACLAGAWCSPALGQSSPALLCRASALPGSVHADGIAELVADIVLTCTADPSALPQIRPDLQLDVEVALNVSVTNRRDFGPGSDVTSAVLVVNGNDCPNPSSEGAAFGSCGAPSSVVQDPQYGRLDGVNRLQWAGVALPFPGALRAEPEGADNPSIVTIRIRGIHGNASQMRLSGGGSRSGAPLMASVSIDPGAGAGIVVQNSPLAVAHPFTGLILGEPDGETATVCLDEDRGSATVHLQEGFPNAFGARGQDGADPRPNSTGGRAARILLEFRGIPDGIDVQLPSIVACHQPQFDGSALRDALTLGLVSGHDRNGSGGSASTASGTAAGETSLLLTEGEAHAVYEVRAQDRYRVEDCHIPVLFEADTILERKAHGRVSASFAPRSSVLVASRDAPQPRFAAEVGMSESRMDFAACRTTLMFPFVTNQAGFDTGVVITHGSPSALIGGTGRERTGSCDLHYFGATPDTSQFLLVQHSTSIDAGEQLVMTVSSGNSAQNILGTNQFEGYIMAVCGFPEARGYAFISDGFGGIADLAMGYLAPIISTDAEGSRIAPSDSEGP